MTPVLPNCFNYTLRTGKAPQSWKNEGKDKKEFSSYRPISVLNVDCKLFASILSKRLESIVPELVGLDLRDFVLNRGIQDNLRRTLQVVRHITSEDISTMLVRLDTEKALIWWVGNIYTGNLHDLALKMALLNALERDTSLQQTGSG